MFPAAELCRQSTDFAREKIDVECIQRQPAEMEE
jgi:hypothetical protein